MGPRRSRRPAGEAAPPPLWRRRPLLSLAVALVVVGLASSVTGRPRAAQAAVPAGTGDLFFTTFNPPTVQRTTYSYLNGTFRLSVPRVVARLSGADGALFSPDGTLLVGGTDSGTVAAINPDTGSVRRFSIGAPAAFMLSTDPTGHTLYTSGLPGQLAALSLDPLAPGRAIPLSGADPQVTGVAFAPGGVTVYTSSGPDGRGDFGLLDLAHGRTQRLLAGVPAAHGVLYDPYSGTFITVGGTTVWQMPARDPGHVVSELTVPGTRLDQGTVDGHGHLFLASNDGRIVFVDYSATRRVGNLANPTTIRPLVANLDDVAPLVGPGARPAPAVTPWWGALAVPSFGGAGLLGLVAGSRPVRAWRRRRRSALPRWDVRAARPAPPPGPARSRRPPRSRR